MFSAFLIRFLGRITVSLCLRWNAACSAYHTHRLSQNAAEFGPGAVVNGSVLLSGVDRLRIGKNVHLGAGAFIRSEGGLVIGDNTHIARNVTIYTHNHNYEGECLPYDKSKRYKPVVIGKNVWIGVNVTIAPGSEIGDGAIVGAGTVVSGVVPPLAIVGGMGLRILKYRDEDHYRCLDRNKRYGGVDGEKI